MRALFLADMELIENSKVNGIMKLWIYQHCVLSRLSSAFMIQDFSHSFALDLEKLVSVKLKRWSGIYRSADVGLLFRSKKNFGLGLTSISMHFERMQLIKCSLLKGSSAKSVRQIYAHRQEKESRLARVWRGSKALTSVESEVELNLQFPRQVGLRNLMQDQQKLNDANSSPQIGSIAVRKR